MKFKSLALAATVLAALAAPVSAQIKEHVFKVGIGLSEDHPQALAAPEFKRYITQRPMAAVVFAASDQCTQPFAGAVVQLVFFAQVFGLQHRCRSMDVPGGEGG